MRELISGATKQEAARRTGFTPARISVLLASPLFKAEMERMQHEVEAVYVEAEGGKQTVSDYRGRLLGEAGKSIDHIVKLRDSSQDERISQRSAMDILNRAGITPPAVEGRAPDIHIEVGVHVQQLLEAVRDMVQEGTVLEGKCPDGVVGIAPASITP
jgi:hypothetical protein